MIQKVTVFFFNIFGRFLLEDNLQKWNTKSDEAVYSSAN